MKKQILSAGHQVHYSDSGDGNTVVLLHGFAESGSIWDPQTASLKDHFRVIVPDLPGSGESTMQVMGSEYPTMEDHASIIRNILDAENIGRVTLIGHSMGGYITLAFAEKFPERLQGIGLVHSTAMPDSEEKKSFRLRSIEFMDTNGAAVFLSEAIPKLYGGTFRKEFPEQVRLHVAESSAQFNTAALSSYYRAMMQRPDRRTVLKEFNGPVLMIAGEDDMTIPLQESLAQCHLPKECHVHILKDVAHMGMREKPEMMNSVLREFLLHVNRH